MYEDSVTLEPLSERIRSTAVAIARSYGAHVEADDVESDIVLAILERYADDPEFLDNTPSYIVSFGAWRARDILRREVTWTNRLVDCQEMDTVPVEVINPSNPWPQVDLRIDVERTISRLDETARRVAYEIVSGGGTLREIGSRVGVSHETVRSRLHVMQAALA